jgi:hypothetical protein
VWCTFQDACCETPSDYLDAGQSDLYVPTVPHGFIREVVIDEQSHARAVYYHHFAGGPVGSRAVRETALLRTVMSKEGGVDDTETVDGFLRRHPHVKGLRLRLTDFNFRTEAAPSKAVAPGGKAAAKKAKATPKARSTASKAVKAAAARTKAAAGGKKERPPPPSERRSVKRKATLADDTVAHEEACAHRGTKETPVTPSAVAAGGSKARAAEGVRSLGDA